MSGQRPFTRYCVYTILHSGKLDEASASGGSGSATENTVWVAGRRMFAEVEKEGSRVPVVFAAAEADAPKGLLYYAELTGVDTDETNSTTTYRFRGLTRIDGGPPLSSLRKRGDGRPLSDGYIRPYSICHTPPFVR